MHGVGCGYGGFGDTMTQRRRDRNVFIVRGGWQPPPLLPRMILSSTCLRTDMDGGLTIGRFHFSGASSTTRAPSRSGQAGRSLPDD